MFAVCVCLCVCVFESVFNFLAIVCSGLGKVFNSGSPLPTSKG